MVGKDNIGIFIGAIYKLYASVVLPYPHCLDIGCLILSAWEQKSICMHVLNRAVYIHINNIASYMHDFMFILIMLFHA